VVPPPDAARGQEDPAPGSRLPRGLDFSDPEVRRALLASLLNASAIDWKEVEQLLRITNEPLDPGVRAILLEELRSGRRNMVLLAFSGLNDGSLAVDLLEIYDDPTAEPGARTAALQALFTMPGADRDEVARALDAPLSADPGKHRELLPAIARRGGPAAARALVVYVQRLRQPSRVPNYILQTLDVAGDPKAAAVLSEALGEQNSPEVTCVLLSIAAQPGAKGFTQQIIALDRDGQDAAVRRQVITSLSHIGDEEAVGFLLRKADEPGTVGEQALKAIGGMRSADPDVCAQLVDALDRVWLNPRPEMAEEKLLLAVGALRVDSALPVVARRLDDRRPKVRVAAVRGLGRMGSKSREHVPKLILLYKDGDSDMRMRVAIALGNIGGERAVEAMEQMLTDGGNSSNLQRTLSLGLRKARVQLSDAPHGADEMPARPR
jgi:HEAT repeat protein